MAKKKTKSLSREDILNANDIEVKDVQVPEWGGKVYVKPLNGAERDKYEKEALAWQQGTEEQAKLSIRAKLVAYSVVDPETKEPLFNTGDIEILSKKNSKPLDRVFQAAQRMNGLTKKDIEELVENFIKTDSDTSSSSSQENSGNQSKS